MLNFYTIHKLFTSHITPLKAILLSTYMLLLGSILENSQFSKKITINLLLPPTHAYTLHFIRSVSTIIIYRYRCKALLKQKLLELRRTTACCSYPKTNVFPKLINRILFKSFDANTQ